MRIKASSAEKMRRWANYLRTTILPQGHGRLLDQDGGYCCLGIACVMASEDPVNPVPLQLRPYDGAPNFAFPTEEVETWFFGSRAERPPMDNGWSLSLQDLRLPFGGENLVPSMANDDRRKTFHEIADAIDLWLDRQTIIDDD